MIKLIYDLTLLASYGKAAAGIKEYLGAYRSRASAKQHLADLLGISMDQWDITVVYVKNCDRKEGIEGPEGEYEDMPFEAEILHDTLHSGDLPDCLTQKVKGRQQVAITRLEVSRKIKRTCNVLPSNEI